MWKYWPILLLSLTLSAAQPPLLPPQDAAAGELSSPETAETEAGHALNWANLADGLDLAFLVEPEEGQVPVRVTALRLDPDHYEFSLHSVAWDGPTALSIEKWAETLNLTAAVNAGMYLPDGKTNTG